eukprot:gene23307-20667_t
MAAATGGGGGWSSLPSLPSKRQYHAMAMTPDGSKLICTGGYDGSNRLDKVDVYEVSTQRWSSLPSMPSKRQYHAMAITPDGSKLICTGGWEGSGFSGGVSDRVDVYELSTQRWSSLPSLPSKRGYHAMAMTPDGSKLICTGGYDGSNRLDKVDVYELSTQRWSSLPSLPSKRQYHAMAMTPDGSKLICTGGTDGSYLDAVISLELPAGFSRLMGVSAGLGVSAVSAGLAGLCVSAVSAGLGVSVGLGVSSMTIPAISLPPFPSGLMSNTEEADAYDEWASKVQAQVDAAGAAVQAKRDAIETAVAASIASATQKQHDVAQEQDRQHQQNVADEERRHREKVAKEERRHREQMAKEEQRYQQEMETHATQHALDISSAEAERDAALADLPAIDNLQDQIRKARQKAMSFRQLHVLQGGSLLDTAPPAAASGGGGAVATAQQIKGREHWASDGARGLDDEKLFTVAPDSAEFQTVAARFAETMPTHQIDTMERVENGVLHE